MCARVLHAPQSYSCKGTPVDSPRPYKTRLTHFVVSFFQSGLLQLYRDGRPNGNCQRGFHLDYVEHTPRMVFGAISSCNPTSLHYNCGHTPMPTEIQGVPACDNGAMASIACARKFDSSGSDELILSLYARGPCTAETTVLNWLAGKQPFRGFAQPKCSQPGSCIDDAIELTVHRPTRTVAEHHRPAGGGMEALFFPPDSTFTGCEIPVHYTAANLDTNRNALQLRNAQHILWQLDSLLLTGGPPVSKPPGQIWFGLTEENEG